MPLFKINQNMRRYIQKGQGVSSPPMNNLAEYVNNLETDEWRHLLQCNDCYFTVEMICSDEKPSVLLYDLKFSHEIVPLSTYLFMDATYKVVSRCFRSIQFVTVLVNALGYI